MAETMGAAGWVSAIRDRAHSKEIRRQILSHRILREVTRRLPGLLPEYLKVLLGSLLGLWVIAALLAYTVNAVPLYTLAAFGLLYSAQAGYYTYKLSVDPDFKIPRCQCSGGRRDDAEKVLRSTQGTVLRIPSAALGIALYAALPLLVYTGHTGIALPVAIVAVLGSAYLGYVMVFRIGGLCVNCISVAAVNLLVLWLLWR